MSRDGKKTNPHELARIVRRQIRVLRCTQYPLRSSKCANHLYTGHKHSRKSYSDFYEVTGICTLLLEELGLERVPHWTTLHKSSKRPATRP